MNIGQRIKDRRIELGLSVDEVAAKIGKNRATVYRYESNDIEDLPTSVLEPLSNALQTTPGYLMGWSTQEVPQSPEPVPAESGSDAKKEKLISNYELLNDEGQQDLVDYSDMLAGNPRKLKEGDFSAPLEA